MQRDTAVLVRSDRSYRDSSTTLGQKSTLGSDVTHGYTFRPFDRVTGQQPTKRTTTSQQLQRLASVLASWQTPFAFTDWRPQMRGVGKSKAATHPKHGHRADMSCGASE
jgi:hypothetical protein